MVEFACAASTISLVLADVDGTLVTTEKVLTSRAAEAVKDLHAAGIDFAITSPGGHGVLGLRSALGARTRRLASLRS